MRTCGKLKLSERITPNVVSINKILTEDFLSYTSMRALECFVEEHIEEESKPGSIFPILTSKAWKKGKKVSAGTYGTVNMMTMFKKSKIVVKTYRSQNARNEVIAEYRIGKKLNELRYYCPNFCYTIGAFSDKLKNREKPSICYEYVGSRSLAYYIHQNTTTPKDLFTIIIQVLLALQIAQNRFGFQHNDLGDSNVMLRDRRVTYRVALDNLEYEFQDVICPVIIDYGFSTVDTGKEIISSLTAVGFEPGDYGKYPFVIQGQDAFFILSDITVYSATTTRPFMLKLMDRIYGKHNSYQHSKLYSRNDQWEEVLNSRACSFSPLEIVTKMIKEFPEYCTSIKLSERRHFEVNSLSTIITQFYEISNVKIERAIERCFSDNNSNIMSLYYSKGSDQQHRKSLTGDRVIIDSFYSMSLTDIMPIVNHVRKLPFSIGHTRESFREFFLAMKVVDMVEIYFIIYYMILEVNQEQSLYRDFADRLHNSDVYTYYKKNMMSIMAARSWVKTLIDYNAV